MATDRPARWCRALVLGGVVLAAAGCASPGPEIGFAGGIPPSAYRPSVPPTTLAPTFALTDPDGRTVTLESLRGRPVLLYLGYSSCVSFCGLELTSMAAAVDAVGADGDEVALVFLSVDPGRDTPDRLRAFTAFFHPDMIGLTGDDAALDAAATSLAAFFRRNDDFKGSATYTVDHSTFTYLLDQEGRLVRAFEPFTPMPEIAAALDGVLRGAASTG